MRLRQALLAAAAAVAAAFCALAPASAQDDPDLVLTGEVTRDDFPSYIELPFEVPEGAKRITVAFDYDAGDARATIDLGLLDPNGFRGWSGGNKSGFTVSETFATPSYLPGPIAPGEWRILLGVPYIDEGATAAYEARIWLDEANGPFPLAEADDAEGGWMRGDLHMHTGHSDGYCANPSGERAPCPVHLTVEAARNAGLDFIAITDHNTISHLAEMNALQSWYDDITLVPGVEVTTFFGHANVFGATDFTEFRLTEASDAEDLLDGAAARGAIVSLNHAGLPSGESCMGCGWTAQTAGATAIEAVNGGNFRRFGGVEHPLSGVRFWERLLNEGARLTAIGGSDNHDATDVSGENQAPIGAPTTVVWTEGRTVEDILAGVRSGRVFIDLAGEPGWRIDLVASANGQRAHMGGVLTVSPGETIGFEQGAVGPEGGTVEFVGPEGVIVTAPLGQDLTTLTGWEDLPWVRADVRSPEGELVLIGNPIYLETP